MLHTKKLLSAKELSSPVRVCFTLVVTCWIVCLCLGGGVRGILHSPLQTRTAAQNCMAEGGLLSSVENQYNGMQWEEMVEHINQFEHAHDLKHTIVFIAILAA